MATKTSLQSLTLKNKLPILSVNCCGISRYTFPDLFRRHAGRSRPSDRQLCSASSNFSHFDRSLSIPHRHSSSYHSFFLHSGLCSIICLPVADDTRHPSVAGPSVSRSSSEAPKMGRPSVPNRRKSTTPHYQTFPTAPPKSKGPPPSDTSSCDGSQPIRLGSSHSNQDASPLPVKQLVVLAIISLSEQTALNSIGPYLPQMASSFPEVKESQVGFYVGIIASSFALAQFATNFFWGWLSDRVGRKPVVLTGTLLTAVCFVAFGFVRTLPQAIIVQAFMGLVNGNQGVVSTCLGEITDRSNQSKAFIYLPVIYGIGGITGPVVGGLLVPKHAHFSREHPYPYLKPNLVATVVLVIDLLIIMIFLEESLEEAQSLPPLGKRVINLFSWAWQFTSSHRPSYLRKSKFETERRHLFRGSDAAMNQDDEPVTDDENDSDSMDSQASAPTFFAANSYGLSRSHVLKRDTLLLMITYLVFQLSNISYNSLYPIFGQAHPPRGRDLSPEEIGFSLAFAGAATIVFQLGTFGRMRAKMGNKITYRVCLAGMSVAFILTPWVGYKDIKKGDGGMSNGKAWLWIELGFVLLIKSLAAVGCLTSFLLLVCSLYPLYVSYSLLSAHANTLTISQDHKLGAKSFRSWDPKRNCSNPLRRWTCSRPLLGRRPLLACHERRAER